MAYNIVLDHELRKQIDAKAKKLGLTTASFIRMAVVKEVQRK